MVSVGPIDLRSDTVTRPTAAMRQSMAQAEVGDDVFGEDPTVRRLEELAAERTGFPAALFVPTGTMGNQIAVMLHTRPGTDVLLEAGAHLLHYELGGMAAWSGAMPRPLPGLRGHLEPAQVEAAIASPNLDYVAQTSLLWLENTHNQAGGTVLEPGRQAALVAVARGRGLRVHIDGARLFNAAAALGQPPAALTQGADSVVFCLSKGLGAPVGSLLCGGTEFIREARVARKRLGGGMRQVGILAAAGLHALMHHVDRLVDDHARAARLALALAESPHFRLDSATVQTNIVVVETTESGRRDALIEELRCHGVLAISMGPGRIRFVTHLDVDDAGIERSIEVVRGLRGAP